MALCLALLFQSTSNADVVSVPIGNGLTVSVMTGSNASSLQNINTNPAATQVNLGDDGNASVPLQFQYSYFGQTFGTSWMHSNGVVSFQSPNVTGNFCCSGENLSTTTNSRYNYSIMSMWTDLYGRTGRNTYYLSTPDSMTYGWYGTSQYGNANNKSSFEVSLNASGALDMRWGGAIVNATTTMGFTGDLSKGQYYQYYHGNNVSLNGLGVSFTGAGSPPPPPPTPSPVVPTQTTTVVPRTTTTASTPVAETTSTSSVSVSVGGVEMTTTGTISAPDNIPQTVKDSIATAAPAASAPVATTTPTTDSTSTAKTETKAGAPMSLIMSTIGKIQEADKATQKAAVQNAAQQVSLSMTKSQDQAASVVSSLNAMSMASSQESTQTTTQQQQTSQQAGNMFGPQASLNGSNQQSNAQSTTSIASTSFSLPTQGRTTQTYTAPSAQSMGISYSLFTPPVAVQSPQPTYAPPVMTQVDVPVMQTNTINSRTNPLAEMMEAKNFFSTNQVEQKQDTLNRNVQMNDLAGGVDITAIANIPKGYDAYTSLALVDGKFYKPEEIYKNQTTTDNVRVLRGLTGGSDRLHQEMINQQFKLGR